MHIAIANGLSRMVDFLTDLPGLHECRGLRAEPHGLSLPVKWGPIGRLSPIQLATFLGDHRMFQHIMRKRAQVLWAWGPVTQYQIALHGIDSIGNSNNDVMDLIIRHDASEKTQQMLDDSMMQGFIHKLFMQKWSNYGRVCHYFLLATDLFYIISLGQLSITTKELPRWPTDEQSTFVHTTLPMLCIASTLPTMAIDIFAAIKYYQTCRSAKLVYHWVRMNKRDTK